MGSVGTSVNTRSSKITSGSVTQLDKYTKFETYQDNIRKDFNLDFATDSQIAAIRSIFKGILEHDKGFDEQRTPYNISVVKIEKTLKDEPKDKTITVSIQTEPNSDSAYIRAVDAKSRFTLIGKSGGYYIYNNAGNRKNISAFDIAYGKNY